MIQGNAILSLPVKLARSLVFSPIDSFHSMSDCDAELSCNECGNEFHLLHLVPS